jgi:hypothetical protein
VRAVRWWEGWWRPYNINRLVSEKINFFWAGQRKNQLFLGWSARKSAFRH